MFAKLISSTIGTSKLNGAIALSVAAMLSFNVVVLTSQVQQAPAFAQSDGAVAPQA